MAGGRRDGGMDRETTMQFNLRIIFTLESECGIEERTGKEEHMRTVSDDRDFGGNGS